MERIGVTDWCLDERGVAAVESCAELGFSALQIGVGDDEQEALLGSAAWRSEMRDAAARRGVWLSGVALNVLEARGTGEPRSLRLVELATEAAAEFGATLVYIPAFGRNRIDGPRALEDAAGFLRSSCRIGSDCGVTIASENTLGVEDNLRLAAAVGDPTFRILLDTYNPRLWGHDVRELVIALAGRLCDQAHVKDGVGGAMGSAALGAGEGEVTRALDAFVCAGYDGMFLIENDYRGTNRLRAYQDIRFLEEYISRTTVRAITGDGAAD